MCGGSSQRSETRQTAIKNTSQTQYEDHSSVDITDDHSDNSSVDITDDHSDNSSVDITDDHSDNSSVDITDDHSDNKELENSSILGAGASQHIENIGFSEKTAKNVLDFAKDAMDSGYEQNADNLERIVDANSAALGKAFEGTAGTMQATNQKILAGVAVAGLAAALYLGKK